MLSKERGRDLAIDVAFVLAVYIALSVVLRRVDFVHVSDDDFARTVIAQEFAYAPKLDPSGTSWLPVPFYIAGLAMKLFGRSFEVARNVSSLLTTLSLGAFFVVARRSFGPAAPRWGLLAAFLWLATFPWLGFLGNAAVPEGYVALWVALAIGSLADRRPTFLPAVLLLLATLSRYEAWSAACAFAVLRPLNADKAARKQGFLYGLLPLAGPAAWMLWNKASHGEYTHFFTRVSRFRSAFEQTSLSFRVLQYPRALWEAAPECLLFLAITLAAFSFMSQERRQRLWAPLCGALAMFVFLIGGNIKDGAPTHHAVRALVPFVCAMAPIVALGFIGFAARVCGASLARKTWFVGIFSGLALVHLALLPSRLRDYPGKDDHSKRTELLDRGRGLRAVARLEIEPCAYEHFALIAGFEAPERVTILPKMKTETAPCPRVTEFTAP